MESLQQIYGNELSSTAQEFFTSKESFDENKFYIKLPIFNGSFESLLSLVEKEKVDICEISLSSITNQYLEYLSYCRYFDLDYSSEFMFIVSCLMELKSKKLLPIEKEEEIEEIESSLVEHISHYKIFKKIAEFLRTKKEEFAKIFHRFKLETDLKPQKQYFLKDVEVVDLVNAFRKILSQAEERRQTYEIVDEIISVEDKIKEIEQIVLNQNEITPIEFESLFRTKTRLEIIVTFLAILELIRLRKIVLKQEKYFDKIYIFRRT